jgi:methionine-rich copper-binding protein CopC
MFRIGVALVLLLAFPGAVFAHATPVDMSPDSGENVVTADEISIRFSERLEQGSSRIRVANEAGQNVETGGAKVGENPYVLTVPIEAQEGIYTVSWSVVSKDDGHFTKGAYAFAVGSSTVASVSDSSVVKLTSWQETTAIFIEFLGNSTLWGILVLLIATIRPVIHKFADSARRLRTLISILAAIGVTASIVGAIWQIYIKGSELALLHSIAPTDAVYMYVQTSAGEATLYRMLAILIFGILFSCFRKQMFLDSYSWRDALLFVPLLVFAYFRASVSHATANPFFPELSIFVNFVHLIDKDLWFGILIALIAMFLFSLRDILRAVIPRAFSILALNLALISITASYIVWLHLRDFSNLTTTEWGTSFLKLAACAILLAALRTYHIFSLKWRPDVFSRWATFTLMIEMIFAGLVVFFSSLVIITSPPAHEPHGRIFTHQEPGIAIRFEKSPFEDTAALLTIKGEHREPIVRIGEGEGALLAELDERFEGGYVFPLALVREKDAGIEVIVPREDGYDARAQFEIMRDDFDIPAGHGRSLDLFTIFVILIALIACGFGIMLEFLGRNAAPNMLRDRPAFADVSSGLMIAFLVGFLVIRLTSNVFANDFRELCLADNNMWHIMQPIKAGVSVSKTPREGCMLASGTYHFADKREYEYMRSLGPANATMSAAPELPRVGVPTELTFALTETDGTPAALSIEHEKILHVIVISADMSHFAHVHADDERALTQREINSSIFTVKYTFPKSATYLIAIDYLHGLTHESRQFKLEVGGGNAQGRVATYSSPANFGGYDVEFKHIPPFSGDISTLVYIIQKDGKPVTDLVSYLGAAMHIAIIKNDLTEFIHTHGEVHPPGYVVPPSTAAATHQHAPPPARFGPVVEAHAVFPGPGLYTVFGEFRVGETVIPTKFTVRVD